MGLYRSWRGGLYAWFPWIRVCMRIMPLCVSVEFLCLSVCLSISLSVYLSLFICLSVCMSLFLSFLSLSLSLSQQTRDPEVDTGKSKSLVETLNQSRSRLTLAGEAHFPNYVSLISLTTTCADPESFVREVQP